MRSQDDKPEADEERGDTGEIPSFEEGAEDPEDGACRDRRARMLPDEQNHGIRQQTQERGDPALLGEPPQRGGRQLDRRLVVAHPAEPLQVRVVQRVVEPALATVVSPQERAHGVPGPEIGDRSGDRREDNQPACSSRVGSVQHHEYEHEERGGQGRSGGPIPRQDQGR